jgi:hypothetical protein
MKTFSSKKSRNLFLAAALVVGSLVFNVGNVAAQGPITPDNPSYQDSVEVFVGTIVAGGRIPVQLENLGFNAPASVPFTTSSYNLTFGKEFTLSDVQITGTGNGHLSLTVNFVFPQLAPIGDVVDTLIISAVGAKSFVLPLRGTIVPFRASPAVFSFAEFVPPGGSSTPKPLTIIGPSGEHKYTFNFTEGTNAFDAEVVGHEAGTFTSLVFANVWFKPPVGVPVGTVFRDTLAITFEDTGWVQKIPVFGRSLHINAEPNPLDFGGVAINETKRLDITVEATYAAFAEIAITDGKHFSYTKGGNWDDQTGGTIHVTFSPDETKDYQAYLVFLRDNFESFTVLLTGEGKEVPSLSAFPPVLDFFEVPVGTTVYSTPITVTLTNPLNQLDYNSFSLGGHDSGSFSVVGVRPGASTSNTDVIEVTVSFTPQRDGEFTATLFVSADYVHSFDIALKGIGVEELASPAPALSPQQTTAISGQATTETPIVSAKDGNITVSGAPVGSSIQLYNLHGQSLKAQTVTSNVEILKTATLPRSVYVVVVNDKNQEILRQKVVV